ncbi:hypothetical protein ACIRBY_37195 [Streptomyces sp. NPDC096136]|uniref:effector-associated constant component EACC1 n=1 Tax=Streptomyces sp. NPDC096136 TaxID=3366076 RepID=UPI00381CAD02
MTESIKITHSNGIESLQELKTFLVRDPETRRLGRIRWENSAPATGVLGDGLDILTLVVTSAMALPSFIQGVSNWVKSHGTGESGVEIKLGVTRITVSGTEDPAQIRRLADVLKSAYPEETPPAGL